MLEMPIWMLALLVFAIFILFALLLEAQNKIRNLILQSIVNANLTSQGFNDIAVDMDQINEVVRKLEAEYEFKKDNNLSKTNN
mgnify:FL=1|tara:strand:- start:152 stop:400 length:249 start_codon:yes stop_codon:yes gene_type:complete